MDILYDGIRYFLMILVFTAITKIFMNLANSIGESLGIGNFVVNLFKKIGAKYKL